MNRAMYAFLAVPAMALLAALGCSQQPSLDPAVVAAHRADFMLTDEPTGAQSILDVHQAMYGEEGGHDHAHDDHAHDEQAHDEADHEHADGEEHADHEHAAEEEHAHGDEEHAEHDHEHADHDHADHDHAEHDHAHHDHEPNVSEMDVVLVGKVGGVANPSEQAHPEFPFAENQAMFFLVDLEAAKEYAEHAKQHAPGEECAFCAANAAGNVHLIAQVQFKGDDGELLAIDARELFNLEEEETVVVRGTATATPTGLLLVDADGLFVRR